MRILPILVLSFFLLIPVVPVEAQGLVTCTGADCDFCDLADMTNGIINWLFGFLTMAAVLLFAEAGFRLVTSGGDVGARDYAKKRLTYVIVGFIIMLASWTIIDTVLKALTRDDDGNAQGLEIWGSFDVDNCVGQVKSVEREIDGLAEKDVITDIGNMLSPVNIVNNPTVSPAGVYNPSGGAASDGTFTYQSGISSQRSHASAELEMLLRCIASQVPAGVGQISSISDSKIVNGSKTWQQCWNGECQHTAGSCHYGNGYGAVGKSYAVDFGDENNASDIIGAAYACGAGYAGVHNGNHVHVSAAACKGN